MTAHKYPFCVKLLGFPADEEGQIHLALEEAPSEGPSYFCLHEDSLQEPDITIANGDDLAALAALVATERGPLQPAVIIGKASDEFAFPQLARPIDPDRMFEVLADLILRRADARAQITSREQLPRPERRRKERLDLDITDPAEYQRRRRKPPGGAVLIVDKRGALRDHVAKLMAEHKLSVEWTDSGPAALRLCEETPISVVIINTSVPGIDPYALCAEIKQKQGAERIAVILLVNSAFPYHTVRARAAGVRGLLDKPVADRHLVSVLKKMLSIPT